MIDFQWDISCGDGVSNYLRTHSQHARAPPAAADREVRPGRVECRRVHPGNRRWKMRRWVSIQIDFVKAFRERDHPFIEARLAGLVASDQQDRRPPWIECVEDPWIECVEDTD